jgi:hypothetical protein
MIAVFLLFFHSFCFGIRLNDDEGKNTCMLIKNKRGTMSLVRAKQNKDYSSLTK